MLIHRHFSSEDDKPQRALEKLFYLGHHYVCRNELDVPTVLTEPSDPKQLIAGALEVLRWRRDVAPGIGQFNPWHDGANMQLTEPEWFITQQLATSTKQSGLRKSLIEAWQLGRVMGKDGNSLKGHRNLEAKADKLIKDLLALLERQGLLV